MIKITTKKELEFYIKADRIMNGLPSKPTFIEYLKVRLLKMPPIMDYLKVMRKLNYYEFQEGIINKLLFLYYKRNNNKLELKLGIHIDEKTCGYGLIVPHANSIRIGGAGNHIGNYCVIQGHTFMTGSQCVVGDAFYLSVGAKVHGPLSLGDNVTVGANSFDNKSFPSNSFLTGVPATVKKDNYQPWFIRDGEEFKERVRKVEKLKQAYF